MKKNVKKTITAILLGAVFAACLVLGFFAYQSLMVTVEGIEKLEQDKPSFVLQSGAEYINEGEKYTGNEIEIKEYKKSEAEYSYYNIDFVSYSEVWDSDDLKALSEELFNNVHGEEMKSVDRVIVYGDREGYAAGTQEKQNTLVDIPFHVYNFLPENISIEYPKRGTIISLYSGNYLSSVEEMSHVLSHEYGHHFVEYHFGIDGKEDDEDSEYYEIRAAGYEDEVRTKRVTTADYMNNHEWYLAEIAAEDYVYLMGSENTKQVVEFYDNQEKLNKYAEEETVAKSEYAYSNKRSRNSTPHENLYMPMPHNVEGLQELFYSVVDDEPKEYTATEENNPDLNIEFVLDNAYYLITWDMPYKDEDVVYTVNLFNEKDILVHSLSTVDGDERAIAKLGGRANYEVKQKISYIYFAANNGYKYKVRISITLPDSTVICSKFVEIKMENSEWFIKRETSDSEQDKWVRYQWDTYK